MKPLHVVVAVMFQSTLPVWGATHPWHYYSTMQKVSIHAPRVGSDSRHNKSESSHQNCFNPRSPCGERLHRLLGKITANRFQSTLPVWGATSNGRNRPEHWDVSIHAPRVGSDIPGAAFAAPFFVSIHAPRVGSDEKRVLNVLVAEVSIHAPRVGSDFNRIRINFVNLEFQSTLPVWGATVYDHGKNCCHHLFQSTLPVWGATFLTSLRTI